MDVPAFVKVSCSFLGILVLYRVKVPLGLAMVASALALTGWSGASANGYAYLLRSLLDPQTILLPLVIVGMLYFIEGLNSTGLMEKTINALKSRFKGARVLSAGLPALIGLLPMPGGALFSAPLVESVDTGNNLAPAHKVAINYWFRHVWEYWWPLYPGVILAIGYSGLPAPLFFALQSVYTPIALIAGYVFLLRTVKLGHVEATRAVGDRRMAALTIGLVVCVVVFTMAGTPILSRYGMSGSAGSLAAMTAGLVVALSVLFLPRGKHAVQSLRMFRDNKTWMMILVVFGAQLYAVSLKCPVGSTGETVVALMRDEFRSYGIPLVAIIMLLPFISGLIMGIALGFVGASFPLLFALLGDSPPLNVAAATATLAFAFGYAGMILSPVHICLVLTNEYFKSPLFKVYRYLLGPAALVALASCGVAAVYYFVL